jgi:hypothetical protein
MKVNRANLSVVTITAADKDQPLLNNVHFTPKGDTVGANGAAVIVVENMNRTAGSASDFGSDEGYTVSAKDVREVLKALPIDKRFGDLLDRVSVEDGAREGNVEFSFSDGVRQRSIEAKRYSYGYVKYQEVFKRAYQDVEKPLQGNTFVVNRKRLLSVLSALDKIAPDSSGVFPMFVTVLENQLLIRLDHPKTQQRIVCAVHLQKSDKVPEVDEWERGLCGVWSGGRKKKGPKRKVRR